MLKSPVSFLSLCARCFKITGAYVSGKARRSGQLAPAMIAPIQKVQLQDTWLMKPEIGGPMIGPNVVAAMKYAIDRPRACGSWYTSAQMPPTTANAQDPPTPTSQRKTTSAAKLGDNADAMENIVSMAKDIFIGVLRPKVVGRISRDSSCSSKCVDMGSVAPAARELAMVEFITAIC